ncbi:MAG: hypothetical protein NDI90_16065 [Nitrospira sp. BO4]|nr:hypothetical protein [Nitrospira sp. BO4]
MESHRKDKASATAKHEAQRQAEEARQLSAEESRAAAEREAEEARRQFDEVTRAAAQREALRREFEETRRLAEEESRTAVAQETQLQEQNLRRRVEEQTRTTAQPDVLLEVTQARDGAVVAARVAPPLPAPRAPRQYRATARKPAPHRPLGSPSPGRDARNRATPIELRLVFEKAGFCRVSLLPRRAVGMPTEFVVGGSGSPLELEALQDEWYQDVMRPDMGRLLREGIEWVGALPDGGAARLSLSGRGIFVLARHGELNGFVSRPRLVIGEEHVVFCVAERLPDVRAAIALTKSPEPTELHADSGIPAGWVGLRGVRPQHPVAPSPDGDIMDALRPLPDIEIALTGGIRIDRQTWLSSFPPTIELLGETSMLGVVTIDGQKATRSPEGGYVAPGWDSAGEHTVWCTSATRAYAIRSGAEAWDPWDAYSWSLGEPTASGTQSRPAICGVLVRPPRDARADSCPIVVVATNPILLGARPGEIEVCTPRKDVRAGFCVGFPWFHPIWAVPADALHCDKRAARVLLIGPPAAVNRADQTSATHRSGCAVRRRDLTRATHAWCEAILEASRKGLQAVPSRVEIAALWKSYKRYAKTLRRSWR